MFWWLLWGVFLFLLVAVPLGYGWGYRRWGPPYPSLYRRRTTPSERDVMGSEYKRDAAPTQYEAARSGWGATADVLWVFLLLAIVWFAILLTF